MQKEPTIVKHRDRDEASLAAVLCLTFELRHSESRMLGQLLMHDYSTKEELRAAASHDDQTIALNTTDVFISSLRKKLARHDIRISTIPTLGYGLDGTARDKIRRRLARYDKELIRPRAGSRAIEPDLDTCA
jgi:DNA-binding response OmpR family regulator